MIIIIQYGLGNVGSIYSMCKYIAYDARVSSSLADIEKATSLILPGVGSFDQAMIFLEKNKLMELLTFKVIEQKTPILGICLGMQLLTEESEEGNLSGLSFIKAKCIKFKFEGDKIAYKIPHMGWNNVCPVYSPNVFFPSINDELRFYFAHSYHLECNPEIVIATSDYGYTFPSAIHKDNIFGVQFHPEKSHQFGMNFLRAYFNMVK